MSLLRYLPLVLLLLVAALIFFAYPSAAVAMGAAATLLPVLSSTDLDAIAEVAGPRASTVRARLCCLDREDNALCYLEGDLYLDTEMVPDTKEGEDSP